MGGTALDRFRHNAPMAPRMRPFGDEGDYQAMRALLREAMIANGLRQFSWHVNRLDYWRWHVVPLVAAFDDFKRFAFLWEDDGELVGFLVPDGPGEAYLNVLPHASSEDLDSDMLSVAEQHLSIERNGRRRMVAWSHSTDETRNAILSEAGYVQSGAAERQGRCRPSSRPVRPSLLAGYSVRALVVPGDLEARSWASWRAFHPDEPDSEYQGSDWYLSNIAAQPLYRPELDLVVAAPNGQIAAFTTIWVDEVTNTACFEPVGTAPEYQRRGLGKALMAEGVALLAELDVRRAFVGGYTEAARDLYAAAGFVNADWSEPWIKEWDPAG